MATHGELFPGRKLRHDGDSGAPEEEYDPPGPLDLDSGVVFLAPRATGNGNQQGGNEAEQAARSDSGHDDAQQEDGPTA